MKMTFNLCFGRQYISLSWGQISFHTKFLVVFEIAIIKTLSLGIGIILKPFFVALLS